MARENREKIMLVLVAIIFLLVDGATARGGKTVTDLKIRRQLKRFNKPAVKSIKSEDGDIIDCVDIYKQPAFDHPLLKNHTIQMKPSNYDREKASSSKPIEQLWHKSGSCPEGTIPILRTQKSDLLRAISSEGNGIKAATPTMESAKLYVEQYVQGGEATINIWNVGVEDGESSTGSMFIAKLDTTDMINSGWIVSRTIFGDDRTRLYGFWAGENGGCYNLLCPGFVQTNQNIALGVVLYPVSYYDGDQFVIDVKMYKDPGNERWWLEFNHNPIGYWPTVLFKNMATNADRIQWGGQVLNTAPGGLHTSTQMGNGHFPNEGFKKAAYFDKCIYFGANNDPTTPTIFYTVAEKKNCYGISVVSKDTDGPGLFFLYGGPGGPNCDA